MAAGDSTGNGLRAPAGTGTRGVSPPGTLLAAIASVSWALVVMTGTAALGLHLLGVGSDGSLGPMTAAVVVLGAGGKVVPSGDLSAFGLDGAAARTALDVAPLGVGLVGALALAFLFLRSLGGAGASVSPSGLCARAASTAVLFVAVLGGLSLAGHDGVTIDSSSLDIGRLPADDLPGGAGGLLPDGLGDLGELGDLGGLLPDRAGGPTAEVRVGFAVDVGATVAGSACWVFGVLLIALLASRRTPLPPGCARLHTAVRPAASALVSAFLVAVLAGCAAAAYAAVGDDHPERIAGAALLGAPNGAWLGIPLGLFVPWDGRAAGALSSVLPDPLGELLRESGGEPVTLGRLAALDDRVWLLAVAAALLMLYAGVLTAVRTPGPPGGRRSAAGFAGRCALRLGAVTAVALPLLVWLTRVSADASLSVLGFDAFGARIELRGHMGAALLLGSVWGAGAGGAGALLACVAGAAGRRAAPSALPGGGRHDGACTYPGRVPAPGPYAPSAPYRPPHDDTNPYLRPPEGIHSAPTVVGLGPHGPAVPPPGPGPEPPGPPAERGGRGDRPGERD